MLIYCFWIWVTADLIVSSFLSFSVSRMQENIAFMVVYYGIIGIIYCLICIMHLVIVTSNSSAVVKILNFVTGERSLYVYWIELEILQHFLSSRVSMAYNILKENCFVEFWMCVAWSNSVIPYFFYHISFSC